jgi:predicted dehydrogenase
LTYEQLLDITSKKYPDKSVLIIGSGFMARQYCSALSKMNVKNVIIISKSKDKVQSLSNEFGFKYLFGGYEKHLDNAELQDLVIITTPVNLLISIANKAIDCGQKNILVEKPGSIYYEELLSLEKKSTSRIKIAYNRLVYPNYCKLKELVEQEGGITSCRYTITERVNTINFKKDVSDVYEKLGISNSLHVISMAHELIGMPREIETKQFGKLDWHPSGSVFVGSGITKKDIPFSYHADWESAGRWGIEIMTKKNAYRLIPLENLFVCKKGSFEWKEVQFKIPYPDVKQGISEEIALMFNPDKDFILPSPKKAASFNILAEKIFGYN